MNSFLKMPWQEQRISMGHTLEIVKNRKAQGSMHIHTYARSLSLSPLPSLTFSYFEFRENVKSKFQTTSLEFRFDIFPKLIDNLGAAVV